MYDQITSNKVRSAALMGVFVLLVALIGYVFGQAMNWSYWGLALALAVSFAMAWGSYWYSDKIVLSMSHARPVDRDREPYIVNTIEGLAIAAGLPVPKAYVIDDPAPNAFATGRNPEHAAIAVTTGLVDKMNRLELEGVIAHELSHVKNYDTLVQTLAAVLAGSVALLSDWMLRSLWWGGGRRRDDGQGGAQLQVIFMLAGLVLAVIAPLFAVLIQMAVSRKREYLADANGALLTRYPDGLASALKKIAADSNKLASANKATESLYIYNPLKDYRAGLNSLFNTHPPIEERVRRLEAM
ncbi:MAG: zinc metalloprotease HtpX [Actinomycetia bacterium]|nr:zinc metalloprotease HtpX [Actinomycetes bacterium]